MKTIRVGILGASGYAGVELLRLLLNHPYIEIGGIYSRSHIGKSIHEVYPIFQNISHLTFESEATVIHNSDVIFASLPYGLSETIAKTCMEANKKFIDLGADFRLTSEVDYKAWYHLSYKEKKLHKDSVYGLSEVYRDKIKQASIIGNPGCYPTSIALALYPLLSSSLTFDHHIIIDAKSGVSGAGKELSEQTHFPNMNESFHPYKVAQHRHTPEIEQSLHDFTSQAIAITFVPHLLPVNRGIISTIYCKLHPNISLTQLYTHYCDTYQNEQFIRILPLGNVSDLKYVTYSNYCDLSLHLDARTNTLIIVSAIDNMIKGAAGQAIQNMNIMFGFKEEAGLNSIPPAF